MSEALLIGLLGARSGILIGTGGAYVLTGISPHSPAGVGNATPANVSPIFVPSDRHVWVLSVLLSLAAGVLPAWKALRRN